MKQTFLLLLLAVLSIQCLAIGNRKLQKIMDSWMGYTKHDLVLSWGAPTRTDDDGDGGQILIYAYMGQNGGLLMPNGTYTDVNTWYDYRIFYVNADRKIYAWRTSREAVPPQQVNVNIYRH